MIYTNPYQNYRLIARTMRYAMYRDMFQYFFDRKVPIDDIIERASFIEDKWEAIRYMTGEINDIIPLNAIDNELWYAIYIADIILDYSHRTNNIYRAIINYEKLSSSIGITL